MNEGSCGKIHKIEDFKNPSNTELVVKLIDEDDLFNTEL